MGSGAEKTLAERVPPRGYDLGESAQGVGVLGTALGRGHVRVCGVAFVTVSSAFGASVLAGEVAHDRGQPAARRPRKPGWCDHGLDCHFLDDVVGRGIAHQLTGQRPQGCGSLQEFVEDLSCHGCLNRHLPGVSSGDSASVPCRILAVGWPMRFGVGSSKGLNRAAILLFWRHGSRTRRPAQLLAGHGL